MTFRERRRLSLREPFRLLLAGLGLCILVCIYMLSQQPVQVKEDDNEVKSADSRFRVRRSDLVVAIPSDEAHVPLIQASWSWRQGIRTVVAVNDSQLAEAFNAESSAWQEQWVYWPDDKTLRGKYRGDTRAALVPFLAHRILGNTYKWLLYGDDDTQWFLEGVLSLVKDLDPEMPYFVTDNLWWSPENGTIGSQPNLEAPRCLPCQFSKYGKQPAGKMQFNAPEGCPCRPQLLCKAAEPGYFDEDCNVPLHLAPTYSSRTYSVHGGAGALLSVGLLRAINLGDVEKCITEHGKSTGGDAFISICLWRLGFAPTDPGPWFNELRMRLFDGASWMDTHSLASHLFEAAEGVCTDPICQDAFLLDKIVTSHIHSRKVESMEKAAESMLLLSQAYKAYSDSRAQ